jgi:signal transduction histidine kinase
VRLFHEQRSRARARTRLVSPSTRRQAILAALIVACLAAAATTIAFGRPPEFVAFVFTCWCGAYLVAGGIGWIRRPDTPTGPLLLVIGVAGALVMLGMTQIPVLKLVKDISASVATVVLFLVLLTGPAGRFSTPADRTGFAVVAGGYLVAVYVVRFISMTGTTILAGAISALLLVLVIGRWRRASPPARTALGPIVVAGIGASVVFLVNSTAQTIGLSSAPGTWVNNVDAVGRALIPFAFLAGLFRLQMARTAVADLVTELGALPAPGRLRDALSHALGDPSLDVGYWVPAMDGYAAADGSRMPLPLDGEDRAVLRIERDGIPVAVIVHDHALEQDPGLVAAVSAAVRLTVENERLTARVESQLEDVRASRARIVEAGDAERKRVERDLHDGAQQRLVSVMLALRLARRELGPGDSKAGLSLDQASAEAKAALAELRELARGLHPTILTESGLKAALDSMADRSPLNVSVDSGTSARFSATVEGTAYFVVSEALANVAKYAEATRAFVRTSWSDDTLQVEISDDGIGGADPNVGSGLRGLVDRLSAVEGTLEIVSPVGGGTSLTARIPATTQAAAPTA